MRGAAPVPRPNMAELTDSELRRLRWHCRRGMLENDLILSRFLERHGDTIDAQQLIALNILLDFPDNDLWELLSGRRQCADPRLAPLVERLRAA